MQNHNVKGSHSATLNEQPLTQVWQGKPQHHSNTQARASKVAWTHTHSDRD